MQSRQFFEVRHEYRRRIIRLNRSRSPWTGKNQRYGASTARKFLQPLQSGWLAALSFENLRRRLRGARSIRTQPVRVFVRALCRRALETSPGGDCQLLSEAQPARPFIVRENRTGCRQRTSRTGSGWWRAPFPTGLQRYLCRCDEHDQTRGPYNEKARLRISFR